MPRFPKAERYESNRQLTTEQPSVLAPADANAGILEQTAKIGQQLQGVSEKLTSAMITVQKTTAEKNFKVGMERILTDAETDPDYNNSDKYYKDIDKLKTESLKGFKFPGVKQDMELQFGYEAQIGKIKVENLFKKKMVDVGRASAQELIDIESKNPSESSESNINNIIDEQVSAGIFSREEGYKIQQKAIKDMKQNAFIYDLQADPAKAEKNLSSNEYQFDVSEQEKARNLYRAELNKIQAENQNGLLTSYLNNEDISSKYVRELMNQKKIDASFAESLIKKIENPEPDKLSQDMAYIEFQDRIMDIQEKGDKASLEEIVGFMSDSIKAHAQGLLDKSDIERILKDRQVLIQKKLEKVSEDVMKESRPKTPFEKISWWTDEYADKKPEIKARMYRKLIDGMMQGKEGAAVLKKVMNDEIEIQLANNLNKSDRQYAVNPETKQRIYSDDGGATWKDEATKKDIQ